MVISKKNLQYIVDTMPAQLDIIQLYEKIRLIASLEERRIAEGLNERWEEIEENK